MLVVKIFLDFFEKVVELCENIYLMLNDICDWNGCYVVVMVKEVVE